MLDNETKRRIDTARDILVGKVPDPKSQVEQITIALIYKFMDDMDAEAEELGSGRTFFAKDFAKYSWSRLMAPSLGGFEVINLYGEAITKMPENPGIPALFRDIFKNAYLPYRDPETLKSFLKVIDDFTYDHSERLGDAFEYLLSVLGSQGDAGQFRTPRHIIDFIIELIDPQKHETILDPACGTAGFLISAWKHILKQNCRTHPGDLLTPDERNRLATNIHGYDISPDMVRLSLVNLYLHGFTNPRIEEYDTLTSEDHWNQSADVILANPPFMSPKGGIKPHKRFSIEANRSEVLFVDYIAEHLTPQGRAAIIVPEGIIFQSGTAYKSLRKLLVEKYLVAVISLPAGIFNPYSGVKTSILVMDRGLASKTDTLLFAKIANDGFNLGAQRRAVTGSDLPHTVHQIKAWLASVRQGEELDVLQNSNLYLVKKTRISENGEYILSGERYRNVETRTSQHPFVSLGDVCQVIAGQSPDGNFYNETGEGLAFYQGKTEFTKMYIDAPKKWTTQVTRTATYNDILMSVRAPVGPVNLCNRECCIGRGLAAIRCKDDSKTAFMYIFYILKALEKEITGNAGAAFASINKTDIEAIQIPLPLLEVQQKIVTEIEAYQKIIDGARQVVENYQPRISIHPAWPVVPFGDIATVGGVITKSVLGHLPYIGADSLESHTGQLIEKKTAEAQGVVGPIYEFSGKRILYSKIRPYLNKLTVVNFHGHCSSDMYPLLIDEKSANILFIAHYLLSEAFNADIKVFYERASIPKINREQLFSTRIPLPDLDIQNAIVIQIEEEQQLVNANKQLIRLFEDKIKNTINRVWGEGEPVMTTQHASHLPSMHSSYQQPLLDDAFSLDARPHSL